ncbi:MAG: MBL fold metallo-hydrolase [Chryseolinea sp.]
MTRGKLIAAFCKGEVLQRQIDSYKSQVNPDKFDVWWLGQSGFLIQWNQQCLLLDPYLSDSLTKKYASTEKPHVRMSELVITPQLLNQIDVVTSSHNHTDHLDAETLKPILTANPSIDFVIPEANREFVCERVGCAPDFPIGLSDGQKVKVKSFALHGVPAAHNLVERNKKGQCKFMGYIAEFGKWRIYHSGDTMWYDNIVDVLKPFDIDIAFLPINGNDPSRGVAGNLSSTEAARLGKAIGARLVIPHHYDMFEFNTTDPEEFVKAAQDMNQPQKVLKHGEHLSFPSLTAN